MTPERHSLNGSAERPEARASWKQDLLRGFVYAVLIIVVILFFSGTASRFIYVDF